MSPSVRSSRGFPKILFMTVMALLVVLLAAGAGVTSLFRWIRSEECRLLLEKRASLALGGRAEVGPLEWLWVGVASPKVRTVTSDAERTREVEAADVRARLKPSSLIQGVWAVEEIVIARARIHVKASDAVPTGKPADKEGPLGERISASAEMTAQKDHIPSWMPTEVVIESVRIGSTDLMFDLPEDKMLELLDTRIEAYPRKKDEVRLLANGGRMVWTRFPAFQPSLLKASGELKGLRLLLSGAVLGLPEGGEVTLSGEFPDEAGISRITGRVKGLPIASAFPSAVPCLDGRVSGEGRATWVGSRVLTMEGRASADGTVVRDLPALRSLADFTGMPRFREPVFTTASAFFERQGNVTHWRDILLDSPGLLRVTGSASIGDDGSLDGNLRAGITSDIVRVIPMARELLSAEERDGYFWIPVRVGGTLSKPTEDLRPRLLTAIAAKASGVLREGIDAGLRMLDLGPGSSAAKDVTNAVKGLEKEAGSVIDAVGGILK